MSPLRRRLFVILPAFLLSYVVSMCGKIRIEEGAEGVIFCVFNSVAFAYFSPNSCIHPTVFDDRSPLHNVCSEYAFIAALPHVCADLLYAPSHSHPHIIIIIIFHSRLCCIMLYIIHMIMWHSLQ